MSDLEDVSPLSRKKLVDTGCVVSRLCRLVVLGGALGVPQDGHVCTPLRTTKKKGRVKNESLSNLNYPLGAGLGGGVIVCVSCGHG